jgi:hypothetical protein
MVGFMLNPAADFSRAYKNTFIGPVKMQLPD